MSRSATAAAAGAFGPGGGGALRAELLAPPDWKSSYARRRPVGRYTQRRAQLREFVLDLLAGPGLRAAHQHRPEELRRGDFALQRVLVPEAQVEREVHRLAARLLRQHRGLDAVAEGAAGQPLLDVLGRRLERLPAGDGRATLVVLHHRGHVPGRRDRGPLRRLRRHIHANRAVRPNQVFLGGGVHVRGGDFFEPVAVQEEQLPVAVPGPVAQLDREPLAVREQLLAGLDHLLLDAVHFLGGDRLVGQPFEQGDERVAHLVGLRRFARRAEEHDAGVVPLERDAENRGRLLRLDQRLVHPPRRFGAEAPFEDRHGRELGRRPRRDVVRRPGHADGADSPQGDHSLAVLGRLLGVRLRQGILGLLDRPEVLGDQFERLRLAELPGDDEHGVVGAVIFLVEGLQVVDRHPLDVGPVTDRRFAVVVPLVRGR